MNNQNIKISVIINGDERQDHKKVEEGDKRRLSETVKIDVSDCTRIKRSTVIILENRFEYDQLKELLDAVMY